MAHQVWYLITYLVPTNISPGEDSPPKLVGMKCMYGGARYTRYCTTSCGVDCGQPGNPRHTGVCPACPQPRPPVQQHPCWPGGKGSEAPGEVRQGHVPSGGTIQRNQQGLLRPHQVCGGGHRQDSIPTLDARSQAPHGAHCTHLFRTGMAFKFGRLYLCLDFSHSTSCTQDQFFFRNRSTYTTIEQILHRWGQVRRNLVSIQQW